MLRGLPAHRADAKDADDAGGSGDAEVGSAFDATYDLGEDDEQREQRPPLHSVAEIAERLRSLPQFAGIRIATLTGRDDDETKSQIMADFEAGVTPILVATTVIEVGVDVAQASCMVISTPTGTACPSCTSCVDAWAVEAPNRARSLFHVRRKAAMRPNALT